MKKISFCLVLAHIVCGNFSFANAPESKGEVAIEACKGAKSNFENKNPDRYWDPEDAAKNPEKYSKCSPRKWMLKEEDRAKRLVSADLLTKAKKEMQKKLDESKKKLEEKKACIAKGAEGKPECAFVENTKKQLRQARISLALSKLDAGCVAAAGRQPTGGMGGALRRCVDKVNLEHEKPWWPGSQSSFTDKMEPLTEGEMNKLTEIMEAKIQERGGNLTKAQKTVAGSNEWFSSLQKAARNDYRAKVVTNPFVRFLDGPHANSQEWQKAFSETEKSLDGSKQDFEKKALCELSKYNGALSDVIKTVPDQFKGDYCQVAGDVAKGCQRQKDVEENFKTAAVMGLGLIPGVGAGLAVGGLTALLEGKNWMDGNAAFQAKMRECAIEGQCNEKDFAAAKEMAEINYAAVSNLAPVAAFGVAKKLGDAPALQKVFTSLSGERVADFETKMVKSLGKDCL